MAIVPDLSGNKPGNPLTSGWDGTDDHIALQRQLEDDAVDVILSATPTGLQIFRAANPAAVRAIIDALGPASGIDASKVVSGTLDPARIPVLYTGIQVVSSGAIAALTAPQQATITAGAVVTTTDGRRWIYSGAGSKTLEASYIELADVTPDWSVIANKPTLLALTATTGAHLNNNQTGTNGVSTDAAKGDHTHPFPFANLNGQTGTTYTVQASDHGKIIEINNAAAITLTVPSTLWTGFNCGIMQLGAGQITVVGSGVNIRNRSGQYKSAGQYAELAIRLRTSTECILAGDTAA